MILPLFLILLSVVGSYGQEDEKGTSEEIAAMEKLQKLRWPDKVVPIKFDPDFPQSKRHFIYNAM